MIIEFYHYHHHYYICSATSVDCFYAVPLLLLSLFLLIDACHANDPITVAPLTAVIIV